MEKQKQRASSALKDVFGFSASDVEANARGQLSPRQAARLGSRQSEWIIPVGASIAVIVLSPLVITRIEQFLVVVAVAGIIALYSYYHFSELSLVAEPVESVEGSVRLVINDNLSKGTYAVSIGDFYFHVTKEQFLAFKNGDPYRIYYAPGSMTILSAEWLRS